MVALKLEGAALDSIMEVDAPRVDQWLPVRPRQVVVVDVQIQEGAAVHVSSPVADFDSKVGHVQIQHRSE